MPKKMLKKMSDGTLEIAHLARSYATPPLLSEKLVAQLQGAVEAAQRNKRTLPPRAAPPTIDRGYERTGTPRTAGAAATAATLAGTAPSSSSNKVR